MCLAVPGKIICIDGDTARVDFGGTGRDVQIQLLAGLEVGQYVLAHAGFAIQVLDTDEAEQTLDLLREAFCQGEEA